MDVIAEGPNIRISINAKAMEPGASAEDLQGRIKMLQKGMGRDDVPVTVNADGDSKQRDVVSVMSAAAACGIKRMRVQTMQHGGS